jgi:hypothetical protein
MPHSKPILKSNVAVLTQKQASENDADQNTLISKTDPQIGGAKHSQYRRAGRNEPCDHQARLTMLSSAAAALSPHRRNAILKPKVSFNEILTPLNRGLCD